MAPGYEQVEFETAMELRSWLEAHHDAVPGIWAVTYKRAAGERHLSYEALVREALCFGWIDGQARRVDQLRSSILLTPRRRGSGWSRPNKLRIAELEAAGLIRPAGLAAIAAAQQNGSWTLLDAVEALTEPDDLRGPLDADPDARTYWDGMPRSAKRAALEWIVLAKRPETRSNRIAAVVSSVAVGRRPR